MAREGSYYKNPNSLYDLGQSKSEKLSTKKHWKCYDRKEKHCLRSPLTWTQKQAVQTLDNNLASLGLRLYLCKMGLDEIIPSEYDSLRFSEHKIEDLFP